MEPFQVTLLLAIALAVGELLTGSFILLGLAIGAAVVAGLQWLGGGLHLNRDLLVFAIASTLAIAGCRRFFRRKDDQQDNAGDVNRY